MLANMPSQWLDIHSTGGRECAVAQQGAESVLDPVEEDARVGSSVASVGSQHWHARFCDQC